MPLPTSNRTLFLQVQADLLVQLRVHPEVTTLPVPKNLDVTTSSKDLLDVFFSVYEFNYIYVFRYQK